MGWYKWKDSWLVDGRDVAQVFQNNFAGSGGTVADGDRDVLFWIESLIMYAIFAIVFSVCSCCCCFGVCCGRWCCSYCAGRNRCSGCGNRFPTLKDGKFSLGFEMLPPEKHEDGFGYSFKEKCGARLFMLMFLFFCTLWLCMAYFEGNLAIGESIKAVADSPRALVTQARNLVTPLANLVQNIIGITFVETIRNMNATFNQGVNFPAVFDSLDCIIESIENLPNPSVLFQFIKDVNASVDQTKALLLAMNPELDKVEATKANISVQVDVIQGYLDTAGVIIDATKSNLTVVNGHLDELFLLVDKLTTGPNGIPNITSDLKQIKNLPNATKLNEFFDAMYELSYNGLRTELSLIHI